MAVRSQFDPTITIVLATHNRREVVLHTLNRIAGCGLSRDQYEIIVVDNASTDGTPDAVEPLVDRLVRLRFNRGSCAKAFGVDVARGEFVLFLDDDSYPRPNALGAMVEHFRHDSRLGAAGFRVHLPSGAEEGAALPDVFVGCGVGFRAIALREVGGLDRTFFMQAEEYDLAFRLEAGDWGVRVFDDLHVDHLKTVHARRAERTTYFDTRNNLRVVGRYLRSPMHTIYRDDCIQRYDWMAESHGHQAAFARGVRSGRRRGWLERPRFRPWRLSESVFERFYRWSEIEQRMRMLAESGVRRIMLADLGKNIFPFLRAAELTGVEVSCIGDDFFAGEGRFYRGTRVTTLKTALDGDFDAIVIANTAPIHAARRRAALTHITSAPVHSWFERPSCETAGIGFSPPIAASDDIYAAEVGRATECGMANSEC